MVQGQFDYTTEKGQITVTGYDCSDSQVDIPVTISGLPFTAIGDRSFSGCTNLIRFNIPNGVTSIGIQAFGDCIKLTSITIPDSVISIAFGAFQGCTKLTSIMIPRSVTHLEFFDIGDTFRDSGLTNIEVDVLNPMYSSKEGVLFNKDRTTLIKYPHRRTGSYPIPDRVSTIGQAAFLGCQGLTSIVIPNTVNTIETLAFAACGSLTSVTIPNGVTKIGGGAFYLCGSLTGISFHGNAPTDYHDSIFEGTDHVTVYYLPGTTGWGSTFANRPTAIWSLHYPVILSGEPGFGVTANGFGFLISWAPTLPWRSKPARACPLPSGLRSAPIPSPEARFSSPIPIGRIVPRVSTESGLREWQGPARIQG